MVISNRESKCIVHTLSRGQIDGTRANSDPTFDELIGKRISWFCLILVNMNKYGLYYVFASMYLWAHSPIKFTSSVINYFVIICVMVFCKYELNHKLCVPETTKIVAPNGYIHNPYRNKSQSCIQILRSTFRTGFHSSWLCSWFIIHGPSSTSVGMHKHN